MSDRINVSLCANNLAAALLRAMKERHVTRIDIDGVRCACIGFLAANEMDITPDAIEGFIALTTRKVVEKV